MKVMKKIFQMHLTEDRLMSLFKTNPEFVEDYRRCNGRFFVRSDRDISDKLITVYVERGYDPTLYWTVTKKNGTFVKVPIEPLREDLFEI